MSTDTLVTQPDAWALFWAILYDITPTLPAISPALLVDDVVFFASTYVLGACACRLRFGTGSDLGAFWALLYLAVSACATSLMLLALSGSSRWADALIALTVSAYIHATRPAWAGGVPKLAQPTTKGPCP
jgi:hypothetical protein